MADSNDAIEPNPATTATAGSSSSSDPLLTSLCAICHVETPRYRCPACSIRTCSLTCTRRHKAWSSCSGIRDATAYVSRSKLRTEAGVDHDYNFLYGIERAVQRSEREIVEEKGLVAADELRPVEVRRVEWRRGKDGVKRKVLVTDKGKGGDGPGSRKHAGSGGGYTSGGRPELSKQMKKRLATFGIYLRQVPLGMTRQKENGTNLQRSSGRIHWQVEWMVLDPSSSTGQTEGEASEEREDPSASSDFSKSAIRILGKALDHLPLYTAFANGQTAHQNSLKSKDTAATTTTTTTATTTTTTDENSTANKKKQKPNPTPAQPSSPAQDPATSTWPVTEYPLQHPQTATWKRQPGITPFTGQTEAQLAQKSAYTFYLSPYPFHRDPDRKTVLHPLDPESTLAEALRDTTVLEFPCIYAVPSSHPLPPPTPSSSYMLSTKRSGAQKRKRDEQGKSAETQLPKDKRARRHVEEGEVAGDEIDGESGDEGDAVMGEAEEQQDVMAGKGPGEENEDDEDDSTSSSGSDSDDDDDDDPEVAASLARKLASLREP